MASTALSRAGWRTHVRSAQRLEAAFRGQVAGPRTACSPASPAWACASALAGPTASCSQRAAHSTHRTQRSVHTSASVSPSGSTVQPLAILVLGGTGFVGRTFISLARRQGHRIVSLSRRGQLPGEREDPGVTWVQGDASDPSTLQRLLTQHPDVNACLHCIGLLLDEGSGLSNFNRLASGSGSQPAPGASYDQITRATAFNAINALGQARGGAGGAGAARLPFVFVSAAEAGWTFTAPVPWLERYLVAKRAVEAELSKADGPVRGVMLRPSLIWTWERPQALLSVLPFYLGSAIGLPFVDRPVTVETVAGAALEALLDDTEVGVKRYMDMERLAARH